MPKPDDKKIILEFIKKHTLMVLSTSSPLGHPQAAVIEFGEMDTLELIFDTHNTSRKYANLKKNPRVACVIGWDDDITVQYEGEAIELSEQESGPYRERFFTKIPSATKWENDPHIRFFKVIPKWIRYSNLQVNPWDIKEVTF